MSRQLDDYVKKHRNEFDFLEPEAALWSKIEHKLGAKSKSRNLSFIWKAAAIIIIFGLSFWAQMQLEEHPPVVTQHKFNSNNNEIAKAPEIKEEQTIKKQTVTKILPEFAETEKYYNHKVTTSMKELKVYLVKYPDVAKDMKKDIAELDSIYKALKLDLGDNIAQEEIISAMIQNYRMKLQILEDIKNELMHNNAAKPQNKKVSHEI